MRKLIFIFKDKLGHYQVKMSLNQIYEQERAKKMDIMEKELKWLEDYIVMRCVNRFNNKKVISKWVKDSGRIILYKGFNTNDGGLYPTYEPSKNVKYLSKESVNLITDEIFDKFGESLLLKLQNNNINARILTLKCQPKIRTFMVYFPIDDKFIYPKEDIGYKDWKIHFKKYRYFWH